MTRWTADPLPETVFCAYGHAAFAQDELQVAEHPGLASVREALIAAGASTSTVEDGQPTPILVEGSIRRAEIDSTWIYGRALTTASDATIRASVRRIAPTPARILAMEAPSGGTGPYSRDTLALVLRTAFAGFRAAQDRAPVPIHTGFWGCGVYGGDRVAMVALQIEAARLAGVSRLVVHAPLRSALVDVHDAIAWHGAVTAQTGALFLDAAASAGWCWHGGDGN